MKRFIATMMVSGLTLLSVNAQEEGKPNCASVEEIIEVLKQRGVTNIVELKSKDGMWIAETVDKSGKRNKEVVVYCSNAKLGTLEAKETVLNAPPADGASLATILARVKSAYGGEVNSAKFKAGKWVVEFSLPYRGSTERLTKHKVYYDVNGKVILNTLTD